MWLHVPSIAGNIKSGPLCGYKKNCTPMQVTEKGLRKMYTVLKKKNQYKPALDIIGVLLQDCKSYFFKSFIFNIMVIRKRF